MDDITAGSRVRILRSDLGTSEKGIPFEGREAIVMEIKDDTYYVRPLWYSSQFALKRYDLEFIR